MNNLNEKPAKGGQGEEMNNLNDKLGLRGKYRTIVYRAATGETETSEWIENTIHTDLKAAVAGNFQTTSDFAINNLFLTNATPPAAGDDGIVIKTSVVEYQMVTTVSGSGSSRTFTGTFTGSMGTFQSLYLGQGYDTGTELFTLTYATPTSWDNITLASADTLTIEWTITAGA